MKPERHVMRRWSPYLLPNILTSLNLMAGFYAIVRIINRDFEAAVYAILLAVVLDGVDGMAARLTRGSSAFGLEFDSMADLVSFGLAPSLFMYIWVLRPYGRIGWVAAFLFVACGTLRLARFNVQSGDVQKYRFLGIPIPMAATQVLTTYLLMDAMAVNPRAAGIIVIITAYATSFLMISAVSYRSLKTFSVRKRYSFYVPVLFMLMAAIIWIYPQFTLWVISTGYILSGPLEAVIGRFILLRHRTQAKAKDPLSLGGKTGREHHE